MATVSDKLLMVQDYSQLPDLGSPNELVRGRIVRTNPPPSRHGQVGSRVNRIIGNFADAHGLGHVLSNDSGVITERDPDTLRGADIAYYSFSARACASCVCLTRRKEPYNSIAPLATSRSLMQARRCGCPS